MYSARYKSHTNINPTMKVLVEYYNRLKAFLWKEANKLLEH